MVYISNIIFNVIYALQKYESSRNAEIREYRVKAGLQISVISIISQTEDNFILIRWLERSVSFNRYDFEEVNTGIEIYFTKLGWNRWQHCYKLCYKLKFN